MSFSDKNFHSPSKGLLDLKTLVQEVADFINEDDVHEYCVAIGSDSEQKNGTAEFVNVVTVHRKGSHGRYFWHKYKDIKVYNLHDRIFKEALYSLELAQEIVQDLKDKIEHPRYGIEIHVDVGENGPTRDMIKEVMGMIRGNGFEAKIKPYAYGAANVADKHCNHN